MQSDLMELFGALGPLPSHHSQHPSFPSSAFLSLVQAGFIPCLTHKLILSVQPKTLMGIRLLLVGEIGFLDRWSGHTICFRTGGTPRGLWSVVTMGVSLTVWLIQTQTVFWFILYFRPGPARFKFSVSTVSDVGY